jgi:DNA-binding GntR family transcriptional regulator
MTSEDVPEVARALLQSCLDSYEKLHIVRALSAAGRELSLDELVQHSGLSSFTIDEALPPLMEAGLVVRAGKRFAYAAGDPQRDAGVAALCALLVQDAVEIAALLNAAAMERARKAIEARMRVAFGVSAPSSDDDADPIV